MTDPASEPTTPSEHENELNDLIEQATRKEYNKGKVRLAWDSFRSLFSGLPRREICHAYHVVKSFADRAAQGTNSEDSNPEMAKKKRYDLAKIQVLLTLASRERDLAQAWTLVNLADALLPLVVEQGQLEACEARLSAWDDDLPETVKQKLKKKEKGTSKDRPYKLLCRQLVRGLHWNVENRKVSMKLTVLGLVGICLFASLGLVIFIAENMFPEPEIASKIPSPFLVVALLGLFGGALSTVIIARKATVSIRSYALIRGQIFLRMLIGAAGAFVVFVAVESGLIGFVEGISNPPVFLIFGIASGFSEQLFVTALEQIGSKVNIADNSTAKSSEKE